MKHWNMFVGMDDDEKCIRLVAVNPHDITETKDVTDDIFELMYERINSHLGEKIKKMGIM